MNSYQKILLVFLLFFGLFSQKTNGIQHKPSSYHAATDTIVYAFQEALYPVKQLWGKVIDTFSPHHPILNDIKNTVDQVGAVFPQIAHEVTDIAEEFTEKARIKAQNISDYALEKTEQTTQRIVDQVSSKITSTSNKALEKTQKVIEISVHNATCAACKNLEKSCQVITQHMRSEFEESMNATNEKLTRSFNQTAQKNIRLTSRSTALTYYSMASITFALATLYKYTQYNQPQDLYFCAAGTLASFISYKALGHLA